MAATSSLESVAESVLRLAKRQGYVTTRDVRAELRMAGLAESEWKAVIAHLQGTLIHRQARYYLKDALSPRMQKEQAQQQAIQKVIRKLIKDHRRSVEKKERREQARIDFVQPVKVRTEDGKEHALLSRDLSPTGVRLLGTAGFLGQRVQLEIPDSEGKPLCRLLVRILWTCAVGDGLFENGGNFLELLD